MCSRRQLIVGDQLVGDEPGGCVSLGENYYGCKCFRLTFLTQKGACWILWYGLAKAKGGEGRW